MCVSDWAQLIAGESTADSYCDLFSGIDASRSEKRHDLIAACSKKHIVCAESLTRTPDNTAQQRI
jgi:hypothetical protein